MTSMKRKAHKPRSQTDEDSPADEGQAAGHDASDMLPPCACRRTDLARREMCGLTPFENVSLDLARLICSIHCGDTPQAWMTALDLAESVAGPFDGPLLVARVTTFVRSVLSERGPCFQFLSAGCLHIGEHEQLMMHVVRMARVGSVADLQEAARRLAERDDVRKIVGSSVVLVHPYPPGATLQAGAPTGEGDAARRAEAERRGAVVH